MNNKRQQLYDRIRSSSKDEVIVEEMKRLGFWPADQDQSSASEDLIKRRGELQRELSSLVNKQRMYDNPEQAVKEMRKQRMADSKQRQKENREKKLLKAYDKALNWYQRRQNDIIYLGQNVSIGLSHKQSDTARLKQQRLPELHNALELSEIMGIDLAELRFLSFDREISRVSHYRQFSMKKKTGGERLISAPMPRLKRAQYWILDNILNQIDLHETAHGFRPAHSIVTNALPHVGAHLVINMDFKDFFPSIKYPRIRGLFRNFGYSDQLASILALLCTEADLQEVELDGEHYFVKQGQRHLPQGAPTSPALTNILCRRLDKRLQGAAQSLGFNYSRYADDLSFSTDKDHASLLDKLIRMVKHIVKQEGFQLHPDKTRIMRASQQQEVTGVVVNQKASLDRETLKRFRALLHQLENKGPEGLHWGQSDNVIQAAKGFANFVAMVDPVKGGKFQQQVKRIQDKYSAQTNYQSPAKFSNKRLRRQASEGVIDSDWWQPQRLAAPEKPPLEIETRPSQPRPVQQSSQQGSSTPPVVYEGEMEQNTEADQANANTEDKTWLDITVNVLMYLIFGLLVLFVMRLSPAMGLLLAVVLWLMFRK